MLRLARTRLPTAAPSSSRRTFVSSVLLDRTYENATVADLKKLLKQRGLPATGNKATLITRIQEHEKRSALAAIAPTPTESMDSPTAVRQQVRHATTVPGLPGSGDVTAHAKQYLEVRLPDFVDEPEPQPQIPYGPDFWSSQAPAHSQPKDAAPPKLLVVASDNEAPAHSVHQSLTAHSLPEEPSTSGSPAKPSRSGPSSIWTDIADDLGIPTSTSVANMESAFFGTTDRSSEVKPQSRPLQPEEKTGVWLLLGLFAGGWVAGGLVNSQKKEKKNVKEAVAEAKENAKEALH
ncbi:hypothetical protein PUNSTDRAFT_114790 [Punctularia strigosozonata HHB-11173 SS5]|uniref:uncharacterized protein n=1 Tax=Punctularia strigosozonata (strain HHB-11173) TaxID=741275 RepID=UPI0004417AF0|nr:uncharacterized protein PUNSTDRAFT_114790 [Punctularia strigosozonata HHB-11173 SS5]EIN07329.1 hypothetical protein PUNSTDRAFT_114790 [Punctularia strigosozonata HHB-11173 SS5]